MSTVDADDLVRAILAEPERVLLHWTLTARLAGMDETTTIVTVTDDRMDMVTQLGMAQASVYSAQDRFYGRIEPDGD